MASGEVLPEVKKVEEMEIVPSDEEEEDEEISLKRRLRASRATDQVATATEGPGESSSTHSSISIPLTPEYEVVLEAPEKEEETPHVEKKAPEKKTVNEGIPEESERETETDDEARYQKERKGKLPAKRIKKMASKANTAVKIQEPIQKPFKQPSSDDKKLSEEEETSSGELYAMSEEEQNPEDVVSLMDEAEVVERITYEKCFVDLDDGLQEEMGKFESEKLQKAFDSKIAGSKDVKSGKVIHLPSLRELAAKSTFYAYVE